MSLFISKVNYSIDELAIISKKLIEAYSKSRIFCFKGDLGAGKTTLIESICKYLGTDDKLSSPTFSIVNEYNFPDGVIYHMDWYRLKNDVEAMNIGVEDHLFSGEYCFIEWYDIAESIIPRPYILINISTLDKNNRQLKAEIVD